MDQDEINPGGAVKHRPFDDVLRIAVLRGGGLGDLIFALPAIDSLARTYPEAEIVVLGTPLHKALLEGRPGPVSRVEVLPTARGVHSPDDSHDDLDVARFLRRMHAERFDLACQFHGGGRYSNPFVTALKARHTVGTRTPDADPLERSMPYVYYQHEVIRWLEAAALAGAADAVTEATIAVTAAELESAGRLIDREARLVVIHPGATDPRRRWPAESFGEIAGRLARHGLQVVVVGDGADEHLADRVAAEARRHAGGSADAVRSLGGRLAIGELVGLLSLADVFVGNDSGPRHLAQAVGAPTASIYWVGNLINGGPLTRTRHRAQAAWTTSCPVCGRDTTQVGWTAPRCEHDLSFVASVSVDAVYEDVRDLLGQDLTATRAPLRGR